MKKIRKIILFIIIILILILAAIRIYHYSILAKISKTTESLATSGEPYFVKTTEINPDETILIREFYKENNIAVSRTITQKGEEFQETSFNWSSPDEEFCNTYWANYYKNGENEYSSLMCISRNEELLKEEFESTGFVNVYFYKFPTISFESEMNFLEKIRFELENKFFYPIVSTEEYKGKECYCFKPYTLTKLYVDKETNLTIAAKMLGTNEGEIYITEYEYLEKAPEEIYEKPNPKDFDIVEFMDSAKENIDSKSKLIAEKPISGTNLNAGEQLVENVELTDKEELNFLKLTPNKSGIIEFEVYNLETYNKFREKYSGLRELTEEDFEAYYVSIAYKPGEKLNYLQQCESKDAWRFNFVVNGKVETKANLLLSVIPNETGNREVDFVESNEKIKIDAETAMKMTSRFLEEITKYFNLEFETYMGSTNDHLELLTKDEFENMDYIKTSISGDERICWNLQYKVNHQTINHMNVFVDAMTGEVIGAINSYK